MKQLIGSSFVVAALTAVSSFACTQPVDEKTDMSQDKIVGGSEATPGEYAGAVALYMGSQQVCGGTLVADEWVVSAGHCVVRPTQPNGGITSIVIGRHKLTDTSTGEQINVKKAIRHEGYNSSTLVNDISLFQLERKATAPLAKLVTPEQAAASVIAEAVTTVVGWGTTREGGRPSDVLLKVDVPIIANDVCKAFPRYNNVAEGMLCAGYPEGGKDSCQGDSGGPLFMKIDGEYRHVGLTSWGIGCARANAPGVYTRTASYLDWLKTNSGGAIGGDVTPPPPPPAEFAGFEENGQVGKDEEKSFSYDVPAGTYNVALTGTNDADLYVKKNEAVAADAWDCRPYIGGSAESCTVTFDAPGKLNVMVKGYAREVSEFTVKGAVATAPTALKH